MHENLGEPITIDDMARTAMFSKFHFSRIFQRVTGISPGRFLSALRLQEAKRLLLATSMTVADISHLVGYNSIGTFSSRFRGSVGVSPTEYRQFRGYVTPLPDEQFVDGEPTSGAGTAVKGQVWHSPTCQPGRVVIGLFSDRIAQGTPVRHATQNGAGPFVLEDVPDGTWYALAYSAETGYVEPHPGQTYVAAGGPVEVNPETSTPEVDMWLRPRRIFDPPALLAQLDQPMWTAQAWASGRVEHTALPGA